MRCCPSPLARATLESPGPSLWQLPNLSSVQKGLTKAGAPCISPKSPPSWQAPQTNSPGTSFPETLEPGRRVPGRTCTSQRSRNAVQEPPWQPQTLPGRVTGIKGIRGITLPSLLGSWGKEKQRGSIGKAESCVYPLRYLYGFYPQRGRASEMT